MFTRRCQPSRARLLLLSVLGLFVLLPLSKNLAVQAPPAAPKAEAPAPAELTLPSDQLAGLKWRSIGPANMSGRITALAVYEADPSTWWAATASGGLLKTTNNGITFEHQFDREATVSIGDVAVAQTNADIVWVGTGENNPRNSVSYGDGVYKSTDGGKKWTNMGLKKSFQIGRIVIHPTNPDIVYVGALGRLYGPNEERGLYRTTDGGKTWERLLYVDDKTGVIDIQMHPTKPDTLLVATFERQRDGYDTNDPSKKWGPGSGLHRTTDGGKTWKKLTKGLPTCHLGRIGIDYYRKNPNVIFITVDSEKLGTGPAQNNNPYMGIQGKDGNGGAELESITENSPAAKAGLAVGDVITALGDKPIRSYRDLTDALRGGKVGDKLKVTRKRDKETKVVEVTLEPRGGSKPYYDRLGGQPANVQDRQGREGFEYGGVYKSTDGGDSWVRVNSLNPRPMYFSCIRVDPTDERLVYVGGVALHSSNDGGRTFRDTAGRGTHADHHALWIDPKDGRHMILGNDGGVYLTYDRTRHWDHLNTMALGQFYHVAVDSRRLYRVYGGLQDNGTWGGPSRTRGPVGPINEDWVNVNGGDGFSCRVDPKDPDLVYFTIQWGRLGRRNFRTREIVRFQPPTIPGGELHFNWNTPFIVSAHDSKIFYAAGNYVLRSADRGRDLRVISPEITATKKGSATVLAESPKNAQVLYVGTDDGLVWISRDGGKEWKNITKNIGLPGLRHVSSIEPSRYVEGRVYVVFDAHRSDDEKPYVYVSEDHGQTWKPLHGELPQWGTTRVLREDIENPNLLYLGTEFYCFCSLDRGKTWVKINNNLPTVAIHELAQHPTVGEIVAATHGRSLWVLDVTGLRKLTADSMKQATLLEPSPAVRWMPDFSRGRTNRRFVGENPVAAPVYYTLPNKADKVTLKILSADGRMVEEVAGAANAGLHRIDWDLSRPGRAVQGQRAARTLVAAGNYRLVLNVDGKELTQTLKVENDPTAPGGGVALEEEIESDKNRSID